VIRVNEEGQNGDHKDKGPNLYGDVFVRDGLKRHENKERRIEIVLKNIKGIFCFLVD
jgi:hypothetical protein